MAVRPVPEGYSTVTPFLIVTGAADAIEFYKRAFEAKVLMRFDGPDGHVAHAEIQIGNSRVMLADEYPQMGFRSPKSIGGAGVGIMLYVDNVDTVFKRALEAGAKTHQEVKDQFYGDRSGTLIDPFGHMWTIATHVEDVSEEDLQRRMESAMSSHGTN
jgi:PhnB protein